MSFNIVIPDHHKFTSHCLHDWLSQFPLIYLFIVFPLWAMLLQCSLECRVLKICTTSDCLLNYAKLHFAPSGWIYSYFFGSVI